VKKVVQVQKITGNDNFGSPISGPFDPLRYSEIMDWIGDRRDALIGSSYYYIEADEKGSSLRRLTCSGGCLYSIEAVEYSRYGISGDEMDDAVRESCEEPEIPNHYCINVHIEKKLRTLLDI
jgi:hypothetical protein